MDKQNDLIQAKIEEALAELALQQGEMIAQQIRSVLNHRLTLKRLTLFIENDLSRVEDYVQLIFKKFNLWHDYVNNIQCVRDTAEWEPLYKNLIHYAYRYFLRKNFDPSISTHDLAEECAGRAAEAILNAHFPYDVDFEPWAYYIVQIQCLRLMRDEMRKKEIPAEKQIELDEEVRITTPDGNIADPVEAEELMRTIEAAIAQLPETRREVLRLKYYEDLPPAEIAKHLGKSIEAVYSLHFNAIQELRKILLETGITFNER
ncbi:MAG: RNA polymerase sigma factor [Anaerolineaceae bacterium]